jgi:hypothetical protein
MYCEKLKGWKMGMLQTKRTVVNFFRQFWNDHLVPLCSSYWSLVFQLYHSSTKPK